MLDSLSCGRATLVDHGDRLKGAVHSAVDLLSDSKIYEITMSLLPYTCAGLEHYLRFPGLPCLLGCSLRAVRLTQPCSNLE